jgi:hypothetical protein
MERQQLLNPRAGRRQEAHQSIDHGVADETRRFSINPFVGVVLRSAGVKGLRKNWWGSRIGSMPEMPETTFGNLVGVTNSTLRRPTMRRR